MERKAKKLLMCVFGVLCLCALMMGMNTQKAEAACKKHSFKWVTVTKSTCSKGGREEYRCIYCNLLNGARSTPTNAHTPNRSSATCTADKKCTVCGTVIQKATGHKANRSAATCTESKVCSTCGVVLQSAYGHTKRYQSATCTENNTCTSCSIILENAKGHNPNRAADCENASTCTRCGKQLAAATGHNPNRTAATCTEDKKCTKCNKVLQSAYGHTKRYQSATCTEDNTCTSCGAVIEKATGHNPNHAADCENASTCTRCGKLLAAATGHNPDRAVATCTVAKRCINCKKILQNAYGHTKRYQSATCTENNTCTSCGAIIEYARGHIANRVADCENPSKCVHCGKTLTPAQGHLTNRSVASCTEDKFCLKCGKVLQKAIGRHIAKYPSATCTQANICTYCGVVLEQKRPHYLVKYSIAPTCYRQGEEGMKCLNCGLKQYATPIRSYEHSWVLDASKSKGTMNYYYCRNSGCNATKTEKKYVPTTPSGGSSGSTSEQFDVALISGDTQCTRANLFFVPTMNFDKCCQNYYDQFDNSTAFDSLAKMDYTDKSAAADFLKYMKSSSVFIYDGHGLAGGESTWMCPSDYVDIGPSTINNEDLSNLDVALIMSCFSAGNCTDYRVGSDEYVISQSKVDDYENDHYQQSVAYAVCKAGAGITIGCNVTILSDLSYGWTYKFTEHYVKLVEKSKTISDEANRKQYIHDMALELALSVTNEECPVYPETELTPYRNTLVVFENDSEGNVIVHRVDDEDASYHALYGDGEYIEGIDDYFDVMLENYK